MAIVVGLEATVSQVPNLTESSQEIRIHANTWKMGYPANLGKLLFIQQSIPELRHP